MPWNFPLWPYFLFVELRGHWFSTCVRFSKKQHFWVSDIFRKVLRTDTFFSAVKFLRSRNCQNKKNEHLWISNSQKNIFAGSLTRPVSISDEEKKLTKFFIFTLLDFLVVTQKVLWRLKGLHKTSWSTTKKCENKNLS